MKKIIGRIYIWLPLLIIIISGFINKIPDETSYEGIKRKNSKVEFLKDLTYEKNGQRISQQEIFKEQIKLIEDAEKIIILDMFLFNDAYNRKDGETYPDLSEQLTSKLIEKKIENPEIKILFITDEINNFYGLNESDYLRSLKDKDIDVVITNTEKIRNSNPIYSGIWGSLIKWFGTSGKGWLPNPFSPDSPKFTLRAYLKLLNFKANHRKVIVSEKSAIITSMNPHDASGNHSNIGFKMQGEIIEDIIFSELEVARMSGYENTDKFKIENNYENREETLNTLTLISEGKIRDNIIREIRTTEKDNEILFAMFYLAHRGVVSELMKASNRGVNIRLVLDPNKDAFGIKKNGIPNRQVAHEMRKKTKGNLKVKWYDTQGEQFHSKMIVIRKEKESIIIAGSANLTRRNIDDYNLETNIMIHTPRNSKLDEDIDDYFNRIWNNEDGHYTVAYEKYSGKSIIKTIIYRFQEWSGLSTF